MQTGIDTGLHLSMFFLLKQKGSHNIVRAFSIKITADYLTSVISPL